LPPDRPVAIVSGSSDVELAVVYAHNPFPFGSDYLVPLWKAPASLDGAEYQLAVGDLDGDGRPEIAMLHRSPSMPSELVVLEENLDVGGPNTPPVLTPIGPKRVAAGSALRFTVSATDVNHDVLTFGTGALPPGATFDALRRTFAWTPTAAQA